MVPPPPLRHAWWGAEPAWPQTLHAVLVPTLPTFPTRAAAVQFLGMDVDMKRLLAGSETGAHRHQHKPKKGAADSPHTLVESGGQRAEAHSAVGAPGVGALPMLVRLVCDDREVRAGAGLH